MKNIPGVFSGDLLPFLDQTPRQQKTIVGYLVRHGKKDFRRMCRAVEIPDDLVISRFSRAQAARLIGAFKLLEADQ